MDQLESNVLLKTSTRYGNTINLMGYCIICLKKERAMKEKEGGVEKLVRPTYFLNTFNEIWSVLQTSSKNDGNGSSSPRVSIKVSVFEEGSKGQFSETPTLCQLCHENIVVVDNLMKAVRRQVEGIKMQLMECRKGGKFEGRWDQFERSLKGNVLEENVISCTLHIVDIFDSSVSEGGQQPNERIENVVNTTNKNKDQLEDEGCENDQLMEEDYHWQESTRSGDGRIDQENRASPSLASSTEEMELCNNSSVKIEDNVNAKNTAGDEDEDDSNWSWDADADDDNPTQVQIKSEQEDDDEADDGNGDDDSNWSWDENDHNRPDTIKSEEMDEGDIDNEEELNDQEEEEEFKSLEHVQNQSISVTEKDPLEIPTSNSKIPKIEKSITVTATPPLSKGPSSSSTSSSSQMSVLCDQEGCIRKFSTVSALFTHKRNCHPSPAQKLLNLQKLKNASALRRPSLSSPSSKKLYPCDLEACTQKLLSLESLHRHKMTCHKDLMAQLDKSDIPLPKFKFPCSCGRRFQSSEARNLHMSKNQSTHPEFRPIIKKENFGNQPCDQCGESVNLSNILEHLSSHLGGSSEHIIKCPNFDQCGHMFTHSKDLHELHLPKITKRLGNSCKKMAQENKCDLICETCGFKAGKRFRLRIHVANEHERGTLPKNINCPITSCTKMFAVKQSVYFHLHVHRKNPEIRNQLCKFCLERIKIEEIGAHLKDKHGIEEVISCDICPYKFSEREGFLEHLKEHKHVSLSCDICGATYTDKLKFSRHQKEHVEDRKMEWKCEVEECHGRIFKQEKSLIYHMNVIHNGIRPYVCEDCGKAFGLKASLGKHRDSVHLGLRPWECEECGERFGTSSILKHHRLIHTGERPNGPMKKIRKRIKRKTSQ